MFVDSKQNKLINLYWVSIIFFIVLTILCATVYNLSYVTIITTTTTRSLFFSYNYSLSCSHHLCKQQHLFVRSIYRRSSNLDCSLHTQRVFTQDWLNYYSSPALSCLLISLSKQSNKRSWSRMFVFSLSQELYRDFIVICVLCTHCLLLRSLLVYLLLSHTVVGGLLVISS